MRRYKPVGRLLEVEVEVAPKVVEEVSMRELRHDTSGILRRVSEGRRAIVTRRGTPVAVILEVEEAVGLCGTVVLTRREAERRMFGEELDRRFVELRSRALSRAPDRRRERGS
jgi:prevent-host-death family protein